MPEQGIQPQKPQTGAQPVQTKQTQEVRISELSKQYEQLDSLFKERSNTALGRIWSRNSPRIKNELDALKSGKLPEEHVRKFIDAVQGKIQDWAEVSKLGPQPALPRTGLRAPTISGV